MHCDVTNTEEVIFAIEAATTIAPLWSVVNCAGIGWPERTIGKDGEYSSAHDLDIYRKVIEINLVGTFNVCRLAATAMSHNTPTWTHCAVPLSTPRRWPPRTDRSDRSRTRRRRAASWDSRSRSRATSRHWRARQLHPARPHRHADLRHWCRVRRVQGPPRRRVLFPKRLGYASEFASLAVELLANSYMNAASVRIDAGIRMQPNRTQRPGVSFPRSAREKR